ncbi:MAG: helix-turn-helix domain-containing protein [Phycisphaera sp.]|nr:MAG: helix-turn-helix domain-containing protein [Phycisphaera sp.]
MPEERHDKGPLRRRAIGRDEIDSAIDPDRFPPILTPDEAARLLRVSKSTVYHMVSRGQLTSSVKRGKPLRFWRDRLIREYFRN